MVGSKSYNHPIPWQVGLLSRDRGFIYCGGVLLSDTYVLSAAHCLKEKDLKFDDNDIALIGATSKHDIDKMHTLSHTHFIHPKYEEFQDDSMAIAIFDFVILTLLKPLNSMCPIAFARLPTRKVDDNFLNGKYLTVSGWGSVLPVTRKQVIKSFPNMGGDDIPLKLPNDLLVVELSYLPNYICQKRYHNLFTDHKAN